MNEFLKPEIIWFIIGTVLALLEFIVPGVILVFIGIACWIVSFFMWIGLIKSVGTGLFVCSCLSIFLIVFLRKYIKGFIGFSSNEKKMDIKEDEEFIGKTVKVVEEINNEKGTGKVKFQGSLWKAKADKIIEADKIAKIIGLDSIILIVE